jgi:hypothetical protein
MLLTQDKSLLLDNVGKNTLYNKNVLQMTHYINQNQVKIQPLKK